MDHLCSGLSEEEVESLSTFLVEANVFQARTSDESVSVEEAQRFLRVTKFNSSKAIDMFKNYHKHRESYQLDNLRPHRNPLSSEIGSKKLEIVGTCDSEGSPIVVFTVSRHDVKSSDHKASMQLLFYTLNQLAESDPENGVVVIMDMRDIAITSFDVRYIASMLSVFRDGYPLLIKSIYIANAPIWAKTQVSISKALKQDTSKIHFVTASDLSGKYFLCSQLPLSLGGSYLPGTPLHKTPQKPPPNIKPSAYRGQLRNGTGDTNNGAAGVNMLVRAFQSGHVTSNTPTTVGGGVAGGSGPGPMRPPPPSLHMKPKPLPPSKAKVSPMALSKVRSRENSNSSHLPAVFKKPHGNGEIGQKGMEGSGKPRTPMLPRTGQSKGSAPLSSQQNKHSVTGSSGLSSKLTSPTRSVRVKVHPQSLEEPSEGGGGIASRIQVFQKKSVSKDWHGATNSSGWGSHAADQRSRSGSTGSHTSSSPNHSNEGSPSKTKKPLIPVKLLTSPDEEREREKGREKVREREKKEKARRGKEHAHEGGVVTKGLSPHVPLPHVPHSAPSLHTHISHTRSHSHEHNVSPYASSSVAMASTNLSADVIDEGEYENVVIKPLPDASSGRGHQQAPPHPQATGSGRGHQQAPPHQQPTSYENVYIKPSPKAQLGHAPLRPRPYQPPSSRLIKRSSSLDNYENIDFSPLSLQSSQHHGHPPPLTPAPVRRPSHSAERVLDDDDTLFGKEGPPGLKREQVIYENFGPDDGNKLMSVEQMEMHISKKGTKGLSAEYLKIKNEPLCGNYNACRLRCNLPKNRYKDVVCYDETRVVLSSIPGQEGSDYIHANYITGYNKPQAFILTQGPKDKTVVDFWRLVWEKNIRVIVMITKCVELGKRKCAQYWPETSDSEGVRHGHVTIQLVKTVNVSTEGYDVHTLKVSSMGTERTIMHYQFLAWPDYGVPSSGQHVLQLLFSVRKTQSRQSQQLDLSRLRLPSHGPPVLVHCSAGVGRSGAFCTLDICIDELIDKNRVNVQGVVRHMRTERAYSVQTDEQYEFCYRTVLEYAKGFTS